MHLSATIADDHICSILFSLLLVRLNHKKVSLHNAYFLKHNGFVTHAAFRDVVGIMHDVSGQAKVTDLHQFPLTDQNIPGGEVTVNALWSNTIKVN